VSKNASFANAQDVFASSCVMNSESIGIEAEAIDDSSGASFKRNAAHAHAKFARFYGPKV
jgi:hypothetical protein